MEWFDPSPIIKNSNRITDIFGYWPSFHDAQIHSLSLSGGVVDPCEPGCESPMLDIKIHLWEMTREVDVEGWIVLAKHTLTEMRFRNVEKLELSNFNYNNCIMEMIFGLEPENLHPIGGGRKPPMITVEIEPGFGLRAKFKCQVAEVLSAVPCDPDGPLTGRLADRLTRWPRLAQNAAYSYPQVIPRSLGKMRDWATVVLEPALTTALLSCTLQIRCET